MLDSIKPFMSVCVNSFLFCPSQGIQVRVAMLVQFVRSHFLGILGQEYYWVIDIHLPNDKKKWTSNLDGLSLQHYPVHYLKQLYLVLYSAIILLPSDIHPVYCQGNCHHYEKRCTSTLALFAHFCQCEYLSI